MECRYPDAADIGSITQRHEKFADALLDLEHHGTIERQHHDLRGLDLLLSDKVRDAPDEHCRLPSTGAGIDQQMALKRMLDRLPLVCLLRGLVELEELDHPRGAKLLALDPDEARKILIARIVNFAELRIQKRLEPLGVLLREVTLDEALASLTGNIGKNLHRLHAHFR